MTATRWIRALSVVCVLGVLSACSDDGAGTGTGSPDASDSAPTGSSTVEARNACTADVEITGAVEASWSGKATSITENKSGPVQYFAAKGKLRLQVIAADDQFDALASLSTPKGTYTSQGGVSADDKGAGADLDSDATGDGKPVHITATIDC